MHFVTYAFVQQVCVEYLQHARHCLKLWRQSNEHGKVIAVKGGNEKTDTGLLQVIVCQQMLTSSSWEGNCASIHIYSWYVCIFMWDIHSDVYIIYVCILRWNVLSSELWAGILELAVFTN